MDETTNPGTSDPGNRLGVILNALIAAMAIVGVVVVLVILADEIPWHHVFSCTCG